MPRFPSWRAFSQVQLISSPYLPHQAPPELRVRKEKWTTFSVLRGKQGDMYILNQLNMDMQLARAWNESPFLWKHINKKQENAHSLRRHYPVQVRRDFLSLTCSCPGQISQGWNRCRHPWCVSYVNGRIIDVTKDVKPNAIGFDVLLSNSR